MVVAEGVYICWYYLFARLIINYDIAPATNTATATNSFFRL